MNRRLKLEGGPSAEELKVLIQAQCSPKELGYRARLEGITRPEKDSRLRDWLMGRLAIGGDPTVGTWTAAVLEWIEGWFEAEAEEYSLAEALIEAQVVAWEERELDREHPHWLVG